MLSHTGDIRHAPLELFIYIKNKETRDSPFIMIPSETTSYSCTHHRGDQFNSPYVTALLPKPTKKFLYNISADITTTVTPTSTRGVLLDAAKPPDPTEAASYNAARDLDLTIPSTDEIFKAPAPSQFRDTARKLSAQQIANMTKKDIRRYLEMAPELPSPNSNDHKETLLYTIFASWSSRHISAIAQHPTRHSARYRPDNKRLHSRRSSSPANLTDLNVLVATPRPTAPQVPA